MLNSSTTMIELHSPESVLDAAGVSSVGTWDHTVLYLRARLWCPSKQRSRDVCAGVLVGVGLFSNVRCPN